MTAEISNRFIANNNPKLSHYSFSGVGFNCSIYPQLGASIHQLEFNKKIIIDDGLILDSRIENSATHYHSSLLFPFPNRLENGTFNHRNERYQLTINEPTYLNSIHGVLCNKAFEVISITDNSINLEYCHSANNEFPFHFKFQLQYSFKKNGLNLKCTAINIDERSFPFGFGWHPYFYIKDYETAEIFFAADKEFISNERKIPIEEKHYSEKSIQLKDIQLDTAYQLNKSEVRLITSNYQLKMKLPENSFLQLFTPNNRKSLAIEPMSCIANSFNNGIGIQTLSSGEKHIWEIILEIE